jgi:hypothetical protein
MKLRPGTRHPLVPGAGFNRTAWLFPLLLAIHVAEEQAGGFTAWAQKYASPRYTQRDFIRINAMSLLSAVAATALVTRTENRRVFFAYYAAVLTQQAVFNPIFHAGATVAFRAYSPGLVSSLAFPALWTRVTRLARGEHRIDDRTWLAALGLGGAIHAAAVAQQVFGLAPVRRALRPRGPRRCRG